MERKEFLVTGVAGALYAGDGALLRRPDQAGGTPTDPLPRPTAPIASTPTPQEVRALFPRLTRETFVNAAGGTPLAEFTEQAIERYVEVMRYGASGERAEWWGGVWSGVRGRFASLIGAQPDEIGLVECTKAGEQIVLDRLPALRDGGTILTNDLHFSGSLHNLEGLRRAGRSVRVVRSEGLRVPADRMIDAISDDTALVTISLVSNVNGHVEEVAEISRAAHRHGAIVFADIIQAAGIVPIDVEAMGIDVAACSSYKWLYGIHGAGFLYVARRHQGTTLPDTLFPGHVVREYPPFAESGAPGTVRYSAPTDANRYRPGHVNYLGYAAVDAGLRFIEQLGVETLLGRSVDLNRRIAEGLDGDRFDVISSHPARSPILALAARDLAGVRGRLAQSNVVVSTGGDRHDLIRISPAIYNDVEDVDRLLAVLNG
jgi:selenocysteine lyase/cysteine desulfurase